MHPQTVSERGACVHVPPPPELQATGGGGFLTQWPWSHSSVVHAPFSLNPEVLKP